MKTFEKATPRPWRLGENPDERHHAATVMAPFACDGLEPYHPLIVQCLRGRGNAPAEVASANAALVVTAVNQFDALNACAELLDEVERKWLPESNASINRVRAALEKLNSIRSNQ
jgi:hypothetical protein